MEGEKLIEAALFVSTEPMALDELSRISGLSKEEARRIVEGLMRSYHEMGSAIEVRKIGDDQYFMQAKDSFATPLIELVKPALGQEVLKTLAIIALRQPITQAEVVKTRGYRAYHHIKELSLKEYVSATPKGRTKELSTTKKFADYFGLSSDLLELKKRVGEMMRSEPSAVVEKAAEESEVIPSSTDEKSDAMSSDENEAAPVEEALKKVE